LIPRPVTSSPRSWRIWLGLLFIGLSGLLFAIHYLIFRDQRNLFFYLVHNLAFLPINILIVTMIIDQVLRVREKRVMLQKLNMVIGAFFSEVGNQLLKRFIVFDQNATGLRTALSGIGRWRPRDFPAGRQLAGAHEGRIDVRQGDLVGLKTFLAQERAFLLGLLENPNLLEHETFTELLWAVFHVAEELAYRPDVSRLSESDLKHLSGDIYRAYLLLVGAWIDYLGHLNGSYPYLFSLEIRLNPFDPQAVVELPSKPDGA